jgi:hypothetical protein
MICKYHHILTTITFAIWFYLSNINLIHLVNPHLTPKEKIVFALYSWLELIFGFMLCHFLFKMDLFSHNKYHLF